VNLTAQEQRTLEAIVHRGLEDASTALSAMTGGMNLTAPRIEFRPLNDVPNIAGGPAVVVVAVYLGIEGDLNGHVMMLFRLEEGCKLADLMFGNPPGTSQPPPDEIALSALAEAGNVCGSSFMNVLANRTGLKVIPTTPAVLIDMAGAILQTIVTELYLSGDDALTIETGFNEGVRGHFLLMPDHDSMARLIAALEAIE
jgi:chemotaxis protein CheC